MVCFHVAVVPLSGACVDSFFSLLPVFVSHTNAHNNVLNITKCDSRTRVPPLEESLALGHVGWGRRRHPGVCWAPLRLHLRTWRYSTAMNPVSADHPRRGCPHAHFSCYSNACIPSHRCTARRMELSVDSRTCGNCKPQSAVACSQDISSHSRRPHCAPVSLPFISSLLYHSHRHLSLSANIHVA